MGAQYVQFMVVLVWISLLNFINPLHVFRDLIITQIFRTVIVVYRYDRVNRLPAASLKMWLRLAGGLTIFMPVFIFPGGATSGQSYVFCIGSNWVCFVMNLWIGLTCVAYCLARLLWLRKSKKNQRQLRLSFSMEIENRIWLFMLKLCLQKTLLGQCLDTFSGKI
jgi:hypothetical protein